uniref:Uncharacterized protein n=1 Tax=Onchocerca volvulus TaxID=6282 RepID=A0A8R1TTX4_ONCVO
MKETNFLLATVYKNKLCFVADISVTKKQTSLTNSTRNISV